MIGQNSSPVQAAGSGQVKDLPKGCFALLQGVPQQQKQAGLVHGCGSGTTCCCKASRRRAVSIS
ncbi:hypothetical protein KAM380_069420 [Aeromonas caviae]|nr:hypothetical protein KAM380_069420 [Aeromonas caviae]